MENKKSIFAKMKEGLAKTRSNIMSRVDELINYYKEIDDEFFDDLEETLIISDMGVRTANDIIESLKKQVREDKIGDAARIKNMLKEKIAHILSEGSKGFELNSPAVILVVGVNGVGKTTTIGKLASLLKAEEKRVIVAAADTFRAAAAEQLEIWCNRAGVPLIRHMEGADPGAVVFDAIQAAKSRKMDVLICDTAGRLHNKKNLMNELDKINRIIDREMPEASKEVLLVIDATTGQNAISQATEFNEVVGITGIVLTKLDGTAKGGIAVAIKAQLDLPIYFVGVGEQMDDLQPFDPKSFSDALLE
ncbi:MAG TPA: signal recognition particle-docking protein FtsY [Candidatus Atribacteria bacterium]|nr:signal recognition particle-docking protein FtsY [Candidatus Atribacteria bacterium]HPT77821.1 signal recognition particle-docking protein FtsY [Candidatus Atribacteria bacterium]